MKIILILSFLFLFPLLKPINAFEINLQNHFGYTAVDVATAMEIDIAGGHELVDWDQFSYKGILQGYFTHLGPIQIGGEASVHRLYFWEEKYQTLLGSPRWDWGTIWTWSLGGLMKHEPSSWFYYQVGIATHTFFNGSGTTFGFSTAFGTQIISMGPVNLPLEFRSDIIFGNSTPVEIGGGIGLNFNISKIFN